MDRCLNKMSEDLVDDALDFIHASDLQKARLMLRCCGTNSNGGINQHPLFEMDILFIPLHMVFPYLINQESIYIYR